MEGGTGPLLGWVMSMLSGEAKEDAWSVDVGASVGELSYGGAVLTRAVVLWRDGETVARAERVAVATTASMGELVGEDLEVRMDSEGGTAWMDGVVLRGRGVEVIVSGLEWGSTGVRVGSVVCAVKVDEILGAGLVARDGDNDQGEGRRGSADGGPSPTPSIEVGTVVVGLETVQGMLTLWSSGVAHGAGRTVVGCAGVDVAGERMVRVRGEATLAWEGGVRALRFGDVEVWLVDDYLSVARKCWEFYGVAFGGQGSDDDAGGGDHRHGEDAVDAEDKEDLRGGSCSSSLEFGSLTVRLGERDGAKEEVTLVDTRTGSRVVGVEEEVLASVGTLEDGYALFEDREEEGLWWISRPVSLKSLLRAARVDGNELRRGDEVQLEVPESGGRLCELEVQGVKIVLGVPPWSDDGVQSWVDAGYDLLVPAPNGRPTELRVGGGECILVSKLTSYNRLDVTVTPRLLVRNELEVACGVSVVGETGVVELGSREEVGLSIAGGRLPFLRFHLTDGECAHRTAPVSLETAGSTVASFDRGGGVGGVDVDVGVNGVNDSGPGPAPARAPVDELTVIVGHHGWTSVTIKGRGADERVGKSDGGIDDENDDDEVFAATMRTTALKVGFGGQDWDRSIGWHELLLLRGGTRRNRHDPKLRVGRANTSLTDRSISVRGFNLDFGRVDDDSVKYFGQLWRLWGRARSSPSTPSTPSPSTPMRITLENSVDVVADVQSIPVSLAIKPIVEATSEAFTSHVKAAVLYAVPRLAYNWLFGGSTR